MKTRCLIVDDEPLAIQLLEKHLMQLDSFEVAGTCNNAVKALEFLNTKEADLMFLDIQMPKISGLDLLKTLRHPPKVIITTAHREYAVEGYDLDIVDYLVKPITFDRFFKSIERYLRSSNQSLPELLQSSEKKYVYVKSGNKFFKLDLDEILYAESVKDYVRVVTREKEIISKYRISDFEAELSHKGFLRVHRSFIVNIKNITAFTATDIEIGKIEIPIGASYKEYVFKMVNR